MNKQSNKITALYCRIDSGEYRPHTLDTPYFSVQPLYETIVAKGGRA